MEKILILGINGFTGRHFYNFIIKHGLALHWKFIGVDKNIKKISGIDCYRINLLNFKKYAALLLKEKPSYIINLAGIFAADNNSVLEQVNAGIAQETFRIIAKTALRVKNILLIGSAAEYGAKNTLPIKEDALLEPVSFYGISKALQTLYAKFYFKNFKIPFNIARTFNVVGNGISPALSVGYFANQMRNAKGKDVIYVGNLHSKRDFLSIEDVVAAYWKILLGGKPGEIYNVCSGRSYLMKDILNHMLINSGKSIRAVVKRENLRKSDILDSYGDNKKLICNMGWQSKKDIFESLSEMVSS